MITPCPFATEACKYFFRPTPEALEGQNHGCYRDTHHKYYPESTFERLGQIASAFREHPDNKEEVCRLEHDQIHIEEPYSEVPTLQDMALFIAEHEGYITPKLRRAIDGQLEVHTPPRSG